MRNRLIVAAALLTGATCSGVGPFDGQPVGDIAVDPGQALLGAIGARLQLSVTDGEGRTLPPGSGASWSSSDSGVATVDGSGMVTASGDGQATITATVGDEQATAAVTVEAAIESTIDVTAMDQSDSDLTDNRVITTITVVAP